MSIIYLCFPKAKWKAQWTLQLSLNQWERKQALDFWWLCSLRAPPESVAPSKLIFPCISKLLCVLSKHLCDLTHKRPISLPSRTRGRTQSCLLTALTGDQACPCLWVLDWDSLLSTRCTMNAHFAPLSSIGCLWQRAPGTCRLKSEDGLPWSRRGTSLKMRLSCFWIPGSSTLPDSGGNGWMSRRKKRRQEVRKKAFQNCVFSKNNF